MLPRERRRFLATLGRRSTVQGLERRGERRYPILLALVAQSAVDQLDEVIALFDQAVSARESRAKARTDEALAERAKKGEARQLLMDVILPVLIDVGVPDENVGGMLRTRIGMDKLREVAAVNWKPLPRDHGRLAALEASYSYLRQFTPHVLNGDRLPRRARHRRLDGRRGDPEGPERGPAAGRSRPGRRSRSCRPGTPTTWPRPARAGDETAFRHYWEMCTVLALRDGLRSGDVFVPGSRRYADPGTYLFTPEQWQPQPGGVLSAGPQTVRGGRGHRPGEGRAARWPSRTWRRRSPNSSPSDVGAIRLDEEGKLVIPPLTAEDIPAEAKALQGRAGLDAAVRADRLAADRAGCPHGLSGRASPTPAAASPGPVSAELKRNVLAVLIAGATNLGLTRMSEACGISYDTLAWTQEWYVREDTVRRRQHRDRQPPLRAGAGQEVRRRHHVVLGRAAVPRPRQVADRPRAWSSMADSVLSTYTHVSDQHSTYGTKQIVRDPPRGPLRAGRAASATRPTCRSASTPPTPTASTLMNFALFDLVGKIPRRRGSATSARSPWCGATPRPPPSALYPHAGPLLADRWNEDLVAGCYPDLLRMGGSLKFGQATASLIVGKWSAVLPPEHPRGRAEGMGPDAAHDPRRHATCPTRPTAGRSPGS